MGLKIKVNISAIYFSLEYRYVSLNFELKLKGFIIKNMYVCFKNL